MTELILGQLDYVVAPEHCPSKLIGQLRMEAIRFSVQPPAQYFTVVTPDKIEETVRATKNLQRRYLLIQFPLDEAEYQLPEDLWYGALDIYSLTVGSTAIYRTKFPPQEKDPLAYLLPVSPENICEPYTYDELWFGTRVMYDRFPVLKDTAELKEKILTFLGHLRDLKYQVYLNRRLPENMWRICDKRYLDCLLLVRELLQRYATSDSFEETETLDLYADGEQLMTKLQEIWLDVIYKYAGYSFTGKPVTYDTCQTLEVYDDILLEAAVLDETTIARMGHSTMIDRQILQFFRENREELCRSK